MNITITFRHMDSSSAVKAYAGEKVSKLQKFLRQPMTAKVTLSVDKLWHVAEARISSGGQHLEAREKTEDMYASIDKMIDKLERQIRGSKGAKQAKTRRGGATLRAGGPKPAEPAPAKTTTKKKTTTSTTTKKTAGKKTAGKKTTAKTSTRAKKVS
jgi:putative sigma-54 modulation protein